MVVAPAASNRPVRRSSAIGAEHDERRSDQQHADRHVDEEHPPPAGAVGQQPAGDHADRRRRSADGAEDPERAVALVSLGERHGEDRERGRRDQRGAESLQSAGSDQQPGRSRQPGQQRRQREDRQADDEDPPPADQVGETAAEHQEAAEQQPVGDHDPLQRALPDVEVALDRGQGDVHDRDVEHDHELGGAGEGEHRAFAHGGFLVCHHLLLSMQCALLLS